MGARAIRSVDAVVGSRFGSSVSRLVRAGQARDVFVRSVVLMEARRSRETAAAGPFNYRGLRRRAEGRRIPVHRELRARASPGKHY